MRAFALAALTALALIFVNVASAESAIPCYAPPADYVVAFDGVRGQAVDGKVTYPYKTVFIEWQGQLTEHSATEVGNTSEHIHQGACIPQGQELNEVNAPIGSTFIDARLIAHNVLNYTVTGANASWVAQGGSQPAFKATTTQVAELNTAFQHSAGNMTHVVFQSYALLASTSNGLRELRWQVQVDRTNAEALVDAWRVSARAYMTLNYPGKPTTPALGAPSCHVNFVRTQNWISYHEPTGERHDTYHYAGWPESMTLGCVFPNVWQPEALAVPKEGDWITETRVTDGGNQLWVLVDPNNHVTPETFAWKLGLGDPSKTGTVVFGGYNNSFTVPITDLDLSPGVHRLMVMGNRFAGPDHPNRPVSTSVVVMPFSIAPPAGDTQAPSAPPNLRRVNPKPTQVKLSWSASTDNVGVAGYRVYRNGVPIANLTSLGLIVQLDPSGPHLLGVEAYDAAGNTSTRSQWVVSPQATAPYWTPSGPQ